MPCTDSPCQDTNKDADSRCSCHAWILPQSAGATRSDASRTHDGGQDVRLPSAGKGPVKPECQWASWLRKGRLRQDIRMPQYSTMKVNGAHVHGPRHVHYCNHQHTVSQVTGVQRLQGVSIEKHTIMLWFCTGQDCCHQSQVNLNGAALRPV